LIITPENRTLPHQFWSCNWNLSEITLWW